MIGFPICSPTCLVAMEDRLRSSSKTKRKRGSRRNPMLVATIGGPVYSLQLRQLLMASGGSYQGQAITETEEMKMKMKKHRR